MIERMETWLRARLQDPVAWNDGLQVLKTVLAGVGAWVLATEVFHLPQPFLAPWSALLVVHATVYRTFSRGAQQIAATVMGVLIAGGIGGLMGLDPMAMTLVLGIGLILGAIPWLGAEGTTVATTALVVITTGLQEGAMVSRLLDTAVGIVTGLLVNLVVWPPLRQRTAITAMDQVDDRIGTLLTDMADGLEADPTAEDRDGFTERVGEWIDETRALDADLDHAWSLVRQARESAWMNPRRSARPWRDPKDWYPLLRGMEQAIAETRSMARTLGRDTPPWSGGGTAFTGPWIDLLRQCGTAIGAADPRAVASVQENLERFTRELQNATTAGTWTVQGALITNLRNILEAMEPVAAANPLGQPRLPLRLDRLNARRRPAV